MIKCHLDEDGCTNLLAILRIMNQISQEQAWAIAYELAASMQRMWPAGNNCAVIESLAQIYIHREGHIHEKSLWTRISSKLDKSAAGREGAVELKQAKQKCSEQKHQQQHHGNTSIDGRLKSQRATTDTDTEDEDDVGEEEDDEAVEDEESTTKATTTTASPGAHLLPTPPITPDDELSDEIARRRPAASENELIASFGMALFWALDYEIPDDEERKLNIAMEYLIVQSQKEMSFRELEEICIKRLPVAKKSQADLHYRQVCKSLVQDTIELSIFLDKIYTATMALSGVDSRHFHLHQQLQNALAANNGRAMSKNNGNNNNKQQANDAKDVSHNEIDYLRIAQQLASESTNNGATNIIAAQTNKSTNYHQNHHHHHHHPCAMLNARTRPDLVKSTNCRDNVIAYRNHFVDDDELSDLGLPLSSLRALKINDWARLWMQVIRELRQRGKIIAT